MENSVYTDVGGNWRRDNNNMIEKVLEGKLFLHSEQGMEGGYLAIQDKKFIQYDLPKFGVTENMKVFDKNDSSKFGITSEPEIYLNGLWNPWPDPICNEPDYKISSLYCGEEKGDLDADKRLMKKYGFELKYTEDKANESYGVGNWRFIKQPSNIELKDGSLISMGGTPTSIPNRPYGIPKNGLTRVTVKWSNGEVEKKRLSDTLLVEGWSYEGLHHLKETDYLIVKDPVTNEIICEGQLDLIPLTVFSQTKNGHFESNKSDMWQRYFTDKYFAELHRNKEQLPPTMHKSNGGESTNTKASNNKKQQSWWKRLWS